ncbi:MAG: hypothetical protein MI757_12635 [Pirellulales bacterium]|nr:hypothetical protein [Pirellulales bacterium]
MSDDRDSMDGVFPLTESIARSMRCLASKVLEQHRGVTVIVQFVHVDDPTDRPHGHMTPGIDRRHTLLILRECFEFLPETSSGEARPSPANLPSNKEFS